MESTTDRFDRAVSPVVAVILMVAVTVILSAVIGTFVLDLGSNVQDNPQAGVTFDQENDGVVVSVISMDKADEVIVRHAGGEETLTSVGESTPALYGDKVTVIGVLDGKETVLQTETPALSYQPASTTWSETDNNAGVVITNKDFTYTSGQVDGATVDVSDDDSSSTSYSVNIVVKDAYGNVLEDKTQSNTLSSGASTTHTFTFDSSYDEEQIDTVEVTLG